MIPIATDAILHIAEPAPGPDPGLDWRERYVIEQRLMNDEPATLTEIGDSFGVSHQRARQLETRARRKLALELHAVATEFDWPTHGHHPLRRRPAHQRKAHITVSDAGVGPAPA